MGHGFCGALVPGVGDPAIAVRNALAGRVGATAGAVHDAQCEEDHQEDACRHEESHQQPPVIPPASACRTGLPQGCGGCRGHWGQLGMRGTFSWDLWGLGVSVCGAGGSIPVSGALRGQGSVKDWGLGGSRHRDLTGRGHRGPGGSGQRRLESRGSGKVGGLGFGNRDIWGHRGLASTGGGDQRGVVSWDSRPMSGGLGFSHLGVWKHGGLVGSGQFRVCG